MCQRPPDAAVRRHPFVWIGPTKYSRLWKIPLHTGVTSVGAVVGKEIGQVGLREHGAGGFLAAQIAFAPHTLALQFG